MRQSVQFAANNVQTRRGILRVISKRQCIIHGRPYYITWLCGPQSAQFRLIENCFWLCFRRRATKRAVNGPGLSTNQVYTMLAVKMAARVCVETERPSSPPSLCCDSPLDSPSRSNTIYPPREIISLNTKIIYRN